MHLNIADTFNTELPADPNRNNTRRQVYDAYFSYVTPRKPSKPQLVHVSDEMLNAIGLSINDTSTELFLDLFSGADILDGMDPYAMCYGGHQFGHWAGQLGDGRAINLAEVVYEDQRWALQLKGAGKTPYSRSADGLAVLRSSIREHLCSEAMYHLGVPTTRSLSLVVTGDQVLRDLLYDGNAAYEKGAIVCRVAPSFLRFGNFQIFAARKDLKNLRILADYTIRHFFPGFKEGTKDGYIQLFKEVTDLTCKMVIHWQRVGFVHGVMNTDNMSMLGLTIDYGPYGWLEGYDDNWNPNTTDKDQRRYRFANQPGIALWNLAQLASALNLIIDDIAPLQEILDDFKKDYTEQYLHMMRSKLGLELAIKSDQELISELVRIIQLTETDMTIFFRNLGTYQKDTDKHGDIDFLRPISDAFYAPEELNNEVLQEWKDWIRAYLQRLQEEQVPDANRRAMMNAVNPKYVLRNYMAQMAIEKADLGEYALIEELYQLLKNPYKEQPQHQAWFAKRPEWARHKVGCSMLSCSS